MSSRRCRIDWLENDADDVRAVCQIVTHTGLVTGRCTGSFLPYNCLLTPALSLFSSTTHHVFASVCYITKCPTAAITCRSTFIMAENNPPPNASPSLRSRALPLANPMQSDRLYNVTQLISPPPEESLRRAAVSCCYSSTLPFDHLRRSARCRLPHLCWQILLRAHRRESDVHNTPHLYRKNRRRIPNLANTPSN